MTLLDHVTAGLEGDEAKALAALRPLFMAIKLTIPGPAFAKLRDAVPEADHWSREAARGDAARTGELLALATPETLGERFERAGLSHDDVNRLGESVGQFLAETLDGETAEAITAVVPLVRWPVGK